MEKLEASSEEPKTHHKRKLDSRVILSLTKPSFLLTLGRVHIRWKYRQRLCYLLEKLVKKHNWDEASGVLSLLRKGTSNDCSSDLNRLKYSVSIRLLKHIEGDHIDKRRIRDIFEVWMSRIRSKTVRVEEKIAIHLEFIFFCLTYGNLGWAHQAALSLMKERNFSCHPMSNLVMGLTFCQLWYTNLTEEVKQRDSNEDYTPQQSDTSGSKFSNKIVNSEGNYADYIHDAVTSRYDLETSVMNDKRNTLVADSILHRNVPMQNDVNLRSAHLSQAVEPLGSYQNSAKNEAGFYNDSGYTCDPSIFSALEGLESWLKPLQLPHSSENFFYLHRQMLNNHYNDAVKYLRLALYSASLCQQPYFLWYRLRASLLEYFYSDDSIVLSNCLEEIMKKVPTCFHSLARLVSMHQNGHCSLESHVEMIALHLEATYPESNTWREFASCLNGNEGEQNAKPSVLLQKDAKYIYRGEIKKSLDVTLQMLVKTSLWQADACIRNCFRVLELLTYKAACASHLYGQECHHVLKVYTHLEEQNDRDLLKFPKIHIENSIRLNVKFQEK